MLHALMHVYTYLQHRPYSEHLALIVVYIQVLDRIALKQRPKNEAF